MILAVINHKGGVGKTTTAVNLAAALALRRKIMLLVDMDGQASASLSLGVERTAFSPSIADALLHGRRLEHLTRHSGIDGLDFITGSPDLAHADLSLAQVQGREQRLKAALAPVRASYDFIILDCPPSLSMLSVNAMVAADGFILPTPPEYLALEGVVGLLEAVEQIHRGIGDHCQLFGILLTQVDYRRKVTGEIVQVIREHYGDLVFKTQVGVDVRLIEAPSFGKSIFQYDRNSTGAEAYAALAGEVIRRSHK